MITVIPAIDIIGGQCVRLKQGDYHQKTTYGDPLDMAKSYEQIGLKRLHVVDLDGAKSSMPVNLSVLEQIATATSLDIQWGGGVKSREALLEVLRAGASRVICGSVAIEKPDMLGEWLDEFGADKIILGADVKDGFVATHGWLKGSQTTLEQVIGDFASRGLRQSIVTDISRDGMLNGPNFELYTRLQNTFKEVDITVSGGISSMADLDRLNLMGLRSVVVGKAIYEGLIELETLEKWLQNE